MTDQTPSVFVLADLRLVHSFIRKMFCETVCHSLMKRYKESVTMAY